MTKLTETNVRTLQAKNGDSLYPDADQRHGVPGLFLRVRSGGSRTYIVQWRQGSLQRRSTVGKVGVLSLDDARKTARKVLMGIGEGNDPATLKARERVAGAQVFLPLAEEYLAHRAGDMKPGSLDQITRHLKKYWKPLYRLAVSKIDRQTVAAELRTIMKQRGPIAADRARSTLSAFFAWCIGEGYTETNPVIGTNKSGQGRDRDRVLTDAELVRIWEACPEGDYGSIVRLLMLTGQRRDEIANLRHAELAKLDTPTEAQIELPTERTKNSRPHDVPLSAPACDILRAAPVFDDREFVFGRGEGGYCGFSRAKTALDAQINKDRPEGERIAPWILHDLRRTMATKLGDLGVEPHVIEAILNHVSGHKRGVAGVYNRSTYARQKRAALDLWAGHLMTLLAQANGANVVPLKSAP